MCINQVIQKEKANQVSAMGEIYANAVMLLTRLGEADDTSRLAFRTIDETVIKLKSGEDGVQSLAAFEEVKPAIDYDLPALHLWIRQRQLILSDRTFEPLH